MLQTLLARARADSPLWLPDLRAAFLHDPTSRPMTLRLTLHDGKQRDYPCAVPRWEGEEERRFVSEYFYACVYNILAACSGQELRLFFDTADAELCALADSLDAVFQLHAAKRHGYGKVINIAGRIARSFGGPAFRFARSDGHDYAPLPETPCAEQRANIISFKSIILLQSVYNRLEVVAAFLEVLIQSEARARG